MHGLRGSVDRPRRRSTGPGGSRLSLRGVPRWAPRPVARSRPADEARDRRPGLPPLERRYCRSSGAPRARCAGLCCISGKRQEVMCGRAADAIFHFPLSFSCRPRACGTRSRASSNRAAMGPSRRLTCCRWVVLQLSSFVVSNAPRASRGPSAIKLGSRTRTGLGKRLVAGLAHQCEPPGRRPWQQSRGRRLGCRH